MAKFLQDPDINLERNFKKGLMLVSGIASIEFEEQELGSKWEFKAEIIDKKNNDAIIASLSKVFKPKKLSVREKFNEKIEGAKFKESLVDMEIEFKYYITHMK